MLNQFVLVGRLKENTHVSDDKAIITLAVPKGYKNENNEYDMDYFECILNGNMAQNVAEYCKVGDLLGVKGKLETADSRMFIVADKISFLSTRKTQDLEQEKQISV